MATDQALNPVLTGDLSGLRPPRFHRGSYPSVTGFIGAHRMIYAETPSWQRRGVHLATLPSTGIPKPSMPTPSRHTSRLGTPPPLYRTQETTLVGVRYDPSFA